MSLLNLGLVFVSLLSVVVYYNALVGNPVITGRALIRLYRLSASTRQGSKAREACRQWWGMAIVPAYVLTALQSSWSVHSCWTYAGSWEPFRRVIH